MLNKFIKYFREDKSLKFAAILVSVLSVLLILFPFVLTVSNAVKDNQSIYEVPPKLIPKSVCSLKVNVDYSEYVETNGSNVLKKVIKEDAINTMYGVYTELDKSSIFEVRYYALLKGKPIAYVRSHKTQLQMEQDYGVFKGVVINKKTLGLKNRAIELGGKIDFKYDLEGLEPKKESNVTDPILLDEINSVFQKKFKINGILESCNRKKNNFLLLESFIHYMKLPQYVYNNNPIIKKYGFMIFVFNTIIVIGFAILSQVFLCSVCAFVISRLMTPKSGRIALLFFMGAMMIPFVSIMLPQLIMYKNMGTYDNYLALLLPFLYPYGFFIYLYKGFFDKIPESLFEAARLDGASIMYLYAKICMPLSKPIISMIALQTFLGNWNDFFWAWMVTEKQELWTLNVALYNISNNSSTKQNALLGIAFVTILPVIIVSIIFSKQLKESIISSGVKG